MVDAVEQVGEKGQRRCQDVRVREPDCARYVHDIVMRHDDDSSRLNTRLRRVVIRRAIIVAFVIDVKWLENAV